MDIASIAVAVSIAVTNSLVTKISDPDNAQKLVDWVISIGEHFWKSKKQNLPANEKPPELPKPDGSQDIPGVNLEDFATKRRVDQISSLMEQLNTYSSNLNRDLERAAKLGGIDSPDMNHRLYNSIQDQKKEILNCFAQLTGIVNKLFNEKVEGLGELKEAIEA